MTLGAFLNGGLSLETLKKELKKIDLSGYSITAKEKEKHGLSGTAVTITINKNQKRRTYKSIVNLIKESSLDQKVKDNSVAIFTKLAEVEGKIHNTPTEDVHFHEIGAVDSIIDIVGICIAIHQLKIEKIYASKIHIGTGFTKSMHGTIPVPAPATAALLKDIPVFSQGIESELTTPTGAAIISHFSHDFGPIPSLSIKSVGYGVGQKDLVIPNMVRIIIGELDSESFVTNESILVLETNIDDMNPEFYEFITEELFKAGALDVFTIAISMKKFRPGTLLKVIAKKEDMDSLIAVLASQTTTAGIRFYEMDRYALERKIIEVETENGPIQIKVIESKGNVTLSPEYEDCKKLALETGKPIKTIYDEAKAQALKMYKD